MAGVPTIRLTRGKEHPQLRWGIFHGTERNGNGTQVPEVNVCIHTLAKLLATHHYKYNSTSTKQEIDQTPGPVVLARSSLACYYSYRDLRKSNIAPPAMHG